MCVCVYMCVLDTLAYIDKNHSSSKFSASKSGFDTTEYSLGDEDDDLRRAIALSEV